MYSDDEYSVTVYCVDAVGVDVDVLVYAVIGAVCDVTDEVDAEMVAVAVVVDDDALVFAAAAAVELERRPNSFDN